MLPTKKRICNKCKTEAKIWHQDKWWCGVAGFGEGVCKNKKKGKK